MLAGLERRARGPGRGGLAKVGRVGISKSMSFSFSKQKRWERKGEAQTCSLSLSLSLQTPPATAVPTTGRRPHLGAGTPGLSNDGGR